MVLLFNDVAIMYSKTNKEINYGMHEVFVLVALLYILCTSLAEAKAFEI
jgi:hypothetical protein